MLPDLSLLAGLKHRSDVVDATNPNVDGQNNNSAVVKQN